MAPLWLEGECLIVVEAAPSKVPAVVQHLQSAGSPAVFVVSEGLSDLAVPEMAAVRTGSEPIRRVRARGRAEHHPASQVLQPSREFCRNCGSTS